MIKDVMIASASASVTYILTRLYTKKERKVNLQNRLISLYDELSEKHLELQAKYDDLALQNMKWQEKIAFLATELENLKKENHKMKIKIMLLQSNEEEPYHENNTPLA